RVRKVCARVHSLDSTSASIGSPRNRSSPMKGFALGLSLSLAFILGCVSAPLIIPRLSAQNPPSTTRWEYLCEWVRGIEEHRALLDRSGAEGWELASQTGYPQPMVCLKRPLR